MLHMRHWYVFLVLLCLPLQWAWAESAACQLKAHVVASYQHARAASHLPVAAGQELREAPQVGAAVQIDMPRWEFELDEEFDIVEQISEPDWGDVAVDDLVCRPPANDNAHGGTPLDPHEFDLPLCVAIAAPVLGDSLFVASQHPPAPAPVFRAYRPPSSTA